MSAADDHPGCVNVRVRLSVFGRSMLGELTLPAGPVRPERLLPLFRSLDEAILEAASDALAKESLAISCRRGCAACCRKLVPVSAMEARWIVEVINELPEPTQRAVRSRFAAARRRLHEAGLLDKLLHLDELTDDECWAVGLEYFRRWITCPFLEQEECRIYPERPLACREYAVTSPPENCFPDSSTRTVRCLNLPFSLSTALARAGEPSGPRKSEWVALVLVPEWAAGRADEVPARQALELLQVVLEQLGAADLS